jgi:hypothetical protein
MERHMNDERKTGAGRAVEREAEEIDRRDDDADNPGGSGPDLAREIAQQDRRAPQDEDADATDGGDEEDDEDTEDDDTEEDEDEDDERGTPGYGDRGTTPV